MIILAVCDHLLTEKGTRPSLTASLFRGSRRQAGKLNYLEASRSAPAFDAHWMLSLPPIARMKQV